MSDVRPPKPRSFAVVGAGPRGTSVLERLCASVPELAPDIPLTVHLIDPAPPGAGLVWRTDQPAELLMNTVASQVTVFTDESVECEGPIRPGPSLYEWAAARPEERLGPDDYPSRAAYGRYLEWAFRTTVENAPENVTVEVHRARAIRLDDEVEDGAITSPTTPGSSTASRSFAPQRPAQTLTLDNGTTISGLSAVVLAQGHLPVVSGQTEATLAQYAERHRLRYLPPANPADVDLSGVASGEPVLLRGLGLNFFDHMALLTAGRGGIFARGADGVLVYHPSGREPQLYAGSRRGVPYQARGDNAKGPSGRHLPLVLTPDVIAVFRKRADEGDPPDFRAEIWPLVAKEVEAVFYATTLLSRPPAAGTGTGTHAQTTAKATARTTRAREDFLDRFLATPHGSPQESAVLDAAGIAPADRWSWDRISRPYGGETFRDPADHRAWLLDRLRRDAAEAALGNLTGPVKAALDVLRDLRNEIRQIVDHAGLTGRSRRDHLDRWYTPLNAFLSIGPPRRRIEEMAALVEAGVLDVIGPRTTVRTADGAFLAESPDVPGSAVFATTLVEARLPEPDLRRSCDPLLSRLLKTGQCRPHRVGGYETGGLDVTRRPYHLIDRQGEFHPRRFALGVPTEGVHWVTAAGARPGVDSVMLSDTDAVARATLRIPPAGEAEHAARNDPRLNVELASID
ncbi:MULTISPECIES: FAD/NAD(P)-binding protein [unclassified Streptomyces]|uniref:FAD/NAD(P)-binding protein n=1 Tax=unclassified Streptomyces TaxID=2593676 RepID=UPI00081F0969|nr:MULTISPECIES: FAD/NAD(P)-binding protein [unclassified Streptomyces]MYZ34704.1 FAD-binding protein [Streptomyces sp. SID4917]SCF69556.1 FAD-NAD(P)-binding [Streptomyces sp. MnatMP-M17]